VKLKSKAVGETNGNGPLSPFQQGNGSRRFRNDQKGFSRLFVRQAPADIFGFVMDTEGVGRFPKAVRGRLAAHGGPSRCPPQDVGGGPTAQEPSARPHPCTDRDGARRKFFEAERWAFAERAPGAVAISARERHSLGHGHATQVPARGYAPASGLRPQGCISARTGFVLSIRHGGGALFRRPTSVPYDRFSDRVMCSISDLSGRIRRPSGAGARSRQGRARQISSIALRRDVHTKAGGSKQTARPPARRPSGGGPSLWSEGS